MASAPQEVAGDLATTAFIEASILFRSLDPDARRDLVELARLVAFTAGEVVSGEADDGFYLVVDGTAAMAVSGPAGPVEVARLERNAFFGVGRVLGGGHAATLTALSDLAAVTFPAPVVAAMADRFPKVRKLLEAAHAAREKEAVAALALRP